MIYRVGENICKQCNKGLISKIYTQLLQPNIKKNRQPNENMGRRPKQTALQRRHTGRQQAHEKMFNITNYWRTVNQYYNEVSPHSGQNAIIKKPTNNKCWSGCGEKGTFLHCCWELVQPLWRTVWKFLK